MTGLSLLPTFTATFQRTVAEHPHNLALSTPDEQGAAHLAAVRRAGAHDRHRAWPRSGSAAATPSASC